MRSILSIIALFSCCTLAAQEYIPTYGRELPRGEVIAYPTAQEAAAASAGDTRYFTRLADWTQKDNVFSTEFTVPFAWANRQVFFHLGWASADYGVRVNGKNDASPAIGAAWVMSQPTLRVRDVLTKSWRSSEENDKVMAEIALVVKTESLNPRTSRIHYELLTPAGSNAAIGYKDVTLDMRREDTVRFLARIPDSMLWNPGRPTQYTLRVKTQHEGRYMEYIELPLGFRTVELRNGQLAVNGNPVALRTREVPPQFPAEEIAKLREQGFNTLRLLPGPVSPALYAVCDTMGMYVIPQAPIDTRSSGESRRIGGNPSNDPAWQNAYVERTEDSYHTSKRHPSVIAFSLATKSANGINLYESYLNMKKFSETRPFIYPDAAGEWNSDGLKLE